jgi:hypothetical protein
MTTTTVPRAVLEQALEALEAMKAEFRALDLPYGSKAYAAGNQAAHGLRAALAQQEPTVRIKCTVVDNQHPSGVPFEQWVNAPRREWRNLTMQEINALPEIGGVMWRMGTALAVLRAIRAVEQALKEKNHG